MNKLIRKLQSKKGESFVELLIAVFIVALGCLLIATMYTSSFNLNLDAQHKDETYYGAVSDMEGMPETDQKLQVKITEKGGKENTVEAKKYGEDDFFAYRKEKLPDEAEG